MSVPLGDERVTRWVVPAVLYLAGILAANYVTNEYGMVAVGFGLVATAGTYFAGLSFVLRDLVQDAFRSALTREVRGRGHMAGVVEISRPSDLRVASCVAVVVAVGAALSYFVSSPQLAVASGTAFLLAEGLDLCIYTPLRRRGYVRAAVASNLVGAFCDTFLFLSLAGFPVAVAWQGQVVGKLTVTAVTVALVVASRLGRRALA